MEGSREVQEILSGLVEGGYLVRDAGWRRMLELTGRGWRLVEALESAGGRSAESEDLLRSPDGARRRLLRADPESLLRAGMSGDELLVVEETPEPEDGELVAVASREEVLVKKVRRNGEDVSLVTVGVADAPMRGPQLPASAVEMVGRVIYAVRPLDV